MGQIKLTQYSKGSGCGCKIAPKVLEEILHSNMELPDNDTLIVGNNTKDDAAVYDLGNGLGLISTVDFFTPIVDDANDFGKIASSNAISDVYAMGGKPILAIAILGWPVDKLPSQLAQKVIEGARLMCKEANIPLAGGHSIDSAEPIFGLAVNGLIELRNLKKNSTAYEGDLIYLTKPLGTGILNSAQKKGLLKHEDEKLALAQMTELNRIGETLGKQEFVHAITDVTGFGLLGHLIEMAEGSKLCVELNYNRIPLITDLNFYTSQGCIPDNTYRNWNAYENKVEGIEANSLYTLCDPQTNGGLLIAVDARQQKEFEAMFNVAPNSYIGIFKKKSSEKVVIIPSSSNF